MTGHRNAWNCPCLMCRTAQVVSLLVILAVVLLTLLDVPIAR